MLVRRSARVIDGRWSITGRACVHVGASSCTMACVDADPSGHLGTMHVADRSLVSNIDTVALVRSIQRRSWMACACFVALHYTLAAYYSSATCSSSYQWLH